ncbi:MAG: heat-shock protein Hsp20 [Chloroflexi bacterium]|nr:MAG: heat-shock protein Hsp20 [Chloroflexota bacterium]
MSIMTWSPLREVETLRARVDELLSEMTNFPRLFAEPFSIPLDVKETDDELVIKASVPGIRPEDIDVEISGDVLTIRGETKEEREEKKGTWHLSERRVGNVYRSIRLPVSVAGDKAQAAFGEGVLTITLPKAEPTPKHHIKVESA